MRGMSNLQGRVNRIVRKTNVFVPGHVLRTICRYLEVCEQERRSKANFAEQAETFWSKYNAAHRRGSAKQTSDLLDMFQSSEDLQESFLLTLIEFRFETNPGGSWVPRAESRVYRHYYHKALDYSI